MKSSNDVMQMGYLSGLYGVRGWLRVHSFTQTPVDILKYKHWWLEPADASPDAWQPFRLVQGRQQGKGLVAQIAPVEGEPISDRDDAAAWVGARIAVARSDLPRAGTDEVYLADLLGLTVRNREQVELGRVSNVMDTGAHPVLEVTGDNGVLLIPFVRTVYVLEVDLAAGCLTVDWEADY